MTDIIRERFEDDVLANFNITTNLTADQIYLIAQSLDMTFYIENDSEYVKYIQFEMDELARIVYTLSSEDCGYYWLKYEDDQDEEPSHEATITVTFPDEDTVKFTVQSWHTAVGQVTNSHFDTLTEAENFLINSNFQDFSN